MARKRDFVGRNGYGFLAVICTVGLFLFGSTAKGQTLGPQSNEGAQAASQSAAKPSLAGTWKLNKDQSDDPRQKMREAMGGQGGGGGMHPRQGGGRPGRGRGGMMAEWSQLNVKQTDANVKVTGGSGRLLATSQPESKAENNDETETSFPPATAEWQGGRLVAKSQGFGGGTTTRTFELSPDGKQLDVTTKIESERFSQPVTFKFVYDRGTASEKNQ